jgi:uncharacterized protein
MTSPYRQVLDTFLQNQANPVDKYGHQPRLYALTQQIGRASAQPPQLPLIYDDDVVYAAAYLHDMGVFIGHRPEDPEQLGQWDHVHYTVGIAPRLLQDSGFPEEKIPFVLRLIETHQPQDEPDSLEATILRDADILEQLGAVGILRAVAKVGRDTRYPTFTSVIAFLERNLAMLPHQIRLPSARKLAEPRITLLQQFLSSVQSEAGNHLH